MTEHESSPMPVTTGRNVRLNILFHGDPLPRTVFRSRWLPYLLLLVFLSCIGEKCYSQADTGPLLSTRTYEVDSASSVLRIYVGRAGLLSRLGHNHVITSRKLSGRVSLVSGQPRFSTAELTVPVESLVVDDPAERKRAGSDYASTPGESDKSATRTNMLGPAVLDGGNYPEITMQIRTVSAGEDSWLFDISLRLKDRNIGLQIPATAVIDDDRIVVDSRFELDHRQLGLDPFSVMGGMLKVAKGIGFELHVEAATR